MAFCKSCDREVGVERKSRAVWIIGFLVLGLLVPLWPVTLPILWSIALLLLAIYAAGGNVIRNVGSEFCDTNETSTTNENYRDFFGGWYDKHY